MQEKIEAYLQANGVENPQYEVDYRHFYSPENGLEFSFWPDGIDKPSEQDLDAYDVEPEKATMKRLRALENPADLARKLEEIALHLADGVALPINPDTNKPYVQEWAEEHKLKAAEVRSSQE